MAKTLDQVVGKWATNAGAAQQAYVDGINGWIVKNGDFFPHWTPVDVAAVGAIIGAQFGVGGGDETRRSEL